MSTLCLDIAMLGLSITSSWGNGHATTYSADRQAALDCLLLEPAQPWPAGRFVVAGPHYPPSIART